MGKLQVTSYELRDMSYKLQVTSYKLRVNKLLLVVIFCCIGGLAGAQSVSYGYDDSGNRTSRTIIMPALAPPPQDSTETVIEDLEEEIVSGVQNPETGDEKSQEVYTDVLSETLISIYPNPTKGELRVASGELKIDNVEIFDMMGRKQKAEGSISTSLNAQRQNEALNAQVSHLTSQVSHLISIDISHLPIGTYIMRITAGDEATSWKIVKN
ncbi:MAG: T9SS type A sorting domain-containing protein [Bacteroidales bacterium]|nr:T9SS type A sorting domain-containing protein [Bacteroidales bacterium]